MTSDFDDFFELPPFGPFHELNGPIYGCIRDGVPVVALRMEGKHRNGGGIMHGGMISMLIDTALVWAARQNEPDQGPLVTTHLSTDFIGAVQKGDWVEAQVDFVKSGRRLNFAHCYVSVGGKIVAQANAQFLVLPRR